MKPSLVVLYVSFLPSVYTTAIYDGSGPSSEPFSCGEIPTVENAEVSSTLKTEYTKGDSLIYNCQQGYIGRVIFACDGNKWVQTGARSARCSRKRCGLPSDIPNGKFTLVNGTEFVYGTTVKYTCRTGYQMVSLVDTRTCLSDGWSNHLPECEEITCTPPETTDNIIVDGLPDYDNSLRYGHHLQFSCKPQFKLVGSREIICGEKGEWNNPLPKCEEVTCKEEQLNNVKIVGGIPPFKPKDSLTFQCTHSQLIMRGQPRITCKEDGTWSSPYPICIENRGCGPPPYVEFADIITPWKPFYSSGERVQYSCKRLYTLHGPSSKICSQEIWHGEFTCLKPCTVTIQDMDSRHIELKHGSKRIIYAPHSDHISFRCQYGIQQGNVALRQQCINGVMWLPYCS